MGDARTSQQPLAVTSATERVLLALSAVATGAFLVWILHQARYGFDFTDESFYLVWISDPFLFDWSMTQFGYIYHPLYRALGGDIVALRQFNMGSVFMLSWCLTGLVLHDAATGKTRSLSTVLIVSAGFSVTSLVVLSLWLTTPSYNALTFKSLLIASIGMVLAGSRPTPKGVLGWVLIGVGGWLSFMSKPSTALALAVSTLIFLLLSKKFSFRLLCLAAAVAGGLLFTSAWAIDGSIQGFVYRLQTGLAFYAHLGSGHTPAKSFRLDAFYLGGNEKRAILLTTTLAFVGAWCALLQKPLWKGMALLSSGAFFSITMAIAGGVITRTAGFGEFQSMVIWSIVLASVALLLIAMRERLPEYLRPYHLSLALLFLVMPHVYAFGTNGNYWWGAGFACMFWLLGGIVLLGPLAQARGGWGFALPLVFATQMLAALLMQTGLNNPYRQPQPLRLNDTVVAVAGEDNASLVLSAGFAEYINVVKSAARNAGIAPGTPVIDLTGQSPGVLYAMQAKSIGQAWTVGGYPGSQKLAEAALALVSCELLSHAWLLVEESGPRSLPTAVVRSYGASFSEQFEFVSTWHTAPGTGGYADAREQKLYKPLDPPRVFKACSDRREQSASR